ncbi:hypothetical protein SAMN04488116_1671 [Flagellimonas flava]|uniref:Uncharacterized protein n=1 Tax=Flagellimonas flava TaxID=570519 RepID=A0A1M5KME0_9FLAO|nr:hypothetical protein SAMN04488116_1671 [Allomuricauda flava]
MENCLECSNHNDLTLLGYNQTLRNRITNFLISFVIEGAEDMSKIK